MENLTLITMRVQGAERTVRVLEDLERFSHLPMKVVFAREPGSSTNDTKVLEFVGLDEEQQLSEWRLANVRVNRYDCLWQFYHCVSRR